MSIGSEPGVNATGNELVRLNHRGKTRRRNSVLDRLCQTTPDIRVFDDLSAIVFGEGDSP